MDAREAGEEINRPGDCVQVPGKREGITQQKDFKLGCVPQAKEEVLIKPQTQVLHQGWLPPH